MTMDFGNSTDRLEFKLALLLLSCELMQWHHPYRRKLGRIEEPLEESGKKKIEKAGLKLNIQKSKIMASSPITSWQIDGETMETMRDFIFLCSKNTADGDCSHEIKRLAPWKKSYDKPRQHIKKQRHYFANKGLSHQSYGFSSSHTWMWKLDHQKGWVLLYSWCFKLWCWRRLLRVPWISGRSNQSFLKEINPKYSL